MLGCERDHDVRILGPGRRRIAVGKIDTAIRQANSVDDAGQFLLRYLSPDFVFHAITQSSSFFNAHSGWGTHMQREFATIHGWEKVLSQPGEQSEREPAGQKEAGHENAAVMNQSFEQPVIPVPDAFKTVFEPGLKAHQGAPANARLVCAAFRPG